MEWLQCYGSGVVQKVKHKVYRGHYRFRSPGLMEPVPLRAQHMVVKLLWISSDSIFCNKGLQEVLNVHTLEQGTPYFPLRQIHFGLAVSFTLCHDGARFRSEIGSLVS